MRMQLFVLALAFVANHAIDALTNSSDFVYQIANSSNSSSSRSIGNRTKDIRAKTASTIKKHREHFQSSLESKQNLARIIQSLTKLRADSCIYGSNPTVEKLCSNFYTANSYAVTSEKNLTLGRIESLIVDADTTAQLSSKCRVGEWCLDTSILSRDETTSLASANKFNHNNQLVCALGKCHDEAEYYMGQCGTSSASQQILQMAPAFCTFNLHNSSLYCAEQVLRIMHVAVAALLDRSSRNFHQMCRDSIYNKKCPSQCKKLALSLKKLESCCNNNLDILKSFKPLGWYFENPNEIEEYCEAPMTSLCLLDGKYYVGFGANVLILSIILAVTVTTFVFLCVYVCCCKLCASSVHDDSEMCKYSKLSEDDNDEFNEDCKDKDIGRFVNHQHGDIRGIIN